MSFSTGSDSVPLAVTYFVEYDTSFTKNSKKSLKKSSGVDRPTKLCSKKQVGQGMLEHIDVVRALQNNLHRYYFSCLLQPPSDLRSVKTLHSHGSSFEV